jgi:hypothetical protein
LFFVSVLCCFNEFVNHGSRWGNAAQALAQWWHPFASSEVRDVLHRAMRLALHRHICMTIKSPAFDVYFLLPQISPLGVGKPKFSKDE